MVMTLIQRVALLNSDLKHIILSLIWQVIVMFTFDSAEDLLALQLSP